MSDLIQTNYQNQPTPGVSIDKLHVHKFFKESSRPTVYRKLTRTDYDTWRALNMTTFEIDTFAVGLNVIPVEVEIHCTVRVIPL